MPNLEEQDSLKKKLKMAAKGFVRGADLGLSAGKGVVHGSGIDKGVKAVTGYPSGNPESITQSIKSGLVRGMEHAAGVAPIANIARSVSTPTPSPQPSGAASVVGAIAGASGNVTGQPSQFAASPSMAQRRESMRNRQLAEGLRMQHRDALRGGANYKDLDYLRRQIDEAEMASLDGMMKPPMMAPQTPQQVAAGRQHLNDMATKMAELPPDQAGPNQVIRIPFEPYNLSEAGRRVERNQDVYAQDQAAAAKANASLKERLAREAELRTMPEKMSMAEGGAALAEAQMREKVAKAVPDDIVQQSIRSRYQNEAAQEQIKSNIAKGELEKTAAQSSLTSVAPNYVEALRLRDQVAKYIKEAKEIDVMHTPGSGRVQERLLESAKALEQIMPTLDQYQRAQVRALILEDLGDTDLTDRGIIENVMNFPFMFAPEQDLFGNKNPYKQKMKNLRESQDVFNRLRAAKQTE